MAVEFIVGYNFHYLLKHYRLQNNGVELTKDAKVESCAAVSGSQVQFFIESGEERSDDGL